MVLIFVCGCPPLNGSTSNPFLRSCRRRAVISVGNLLERGDCVIVMSIDPYLLGARERRFASPHPILRRARGKIQLVHKFVLEEVEWTTRCSRRMGLRTQEAQAMCVSVPSHYPTGFSSIRFTS